MARQRFRRRSTRPRAPKTHIGTCEFCGLTEETRRYRIYVSRGDSPRNHVWLCARCCADAQCGHIHSGTLGLIAHEREDAVLRDAMGHAAYARDGHGAVRQIRV
ncbi:MAG: hypothetical protein KGL39_17475 [Patescibacteria group bacterium]|nr:hypothetical protein [Patescibacteria group bacterium]